MPASEGADRGIAKHLGDVVVAGVYYFEEKFALGEQLNMDTQYCNVLVPAGPGRTACAAYYASTGGVAATGQDVY